MSSSSSVPSLGHNAAWTIIGNVVYAACQLGMLTVLAKLGSASQLGRFSIALAVATPVVSLCTLQLRNLQATDFTGRRQFGDYLGLRLLGMAAALLIITIIAAVGYVGETACAIVAVAVAKAIEAVSDVAFGLLQRHERMRRIAISQIAKGGLSLAAIAIGSYYTGNVAWCGVALAIAWALTLIVIDIPAVVRLRGDASAIAPNFNIKQLSALAWLALPLGLAFAMLTLINGLPRLFLEHSHGLADVGVFAAMMTLILPGTLVVGALGQAVSPRLASACARGDRAQMRMLFRRLLAIAALIGTCGIVVVLVGGHWALRLLYSEQIASGAIHLPAVMVAGGLWCLSSVLGITAVATNRLRGQPVATAITLVATLVSGSFLVPAYGLTGAAITAVISAAVMLPLLAVVVIAKDDRSAARVSESAV